MDAGKIARKRAARARRRSRTRKTVVGTPDRPRLVVHRSLRNIEAQIIDDHSGHSLVGISTLSKDLGKTAPNGWSRVANLARWLQKRQKSGESTAWFSIARGSCTMALSGCRRWCPRRRVEFLIEDRLTKKATGSWKLAKQIDAGNMELAEVVVQNSVRRVSHVRKGGGISASQPWWWWVTATDMSVWARERLARSQRRYARGRKNAKKNVVEIPVVDGTIPHQGGRQVQAPPKVLLKPASPGTGVIASGGIRIVLDLAGVHDILTKSLGSSNSQNTIKATMEGLRELRNVEAVAKLRGVPVQGLR